MATLPRRRHIRAVFNETCPAMHPLPAAAPAPALANLPAPRQDTRAWRLQVWVSFAAAVGLCVTGLAWLPGADLDRAFMVMGYLFCLSSAFAVAKYVRDNEVRRSDTPLWGAVVWGGFGLAMALTAWGLWRMGINPSYKAYLGVCWLFLISSVFTLAKTLRDAHEAARAAQSPQED
jgi:hypothetical protein